MKAIFCCACGSVPDYCKKSFKIIFPGEQLPQMYIKSKAKNLLDTIPVDSEAYKQIALVALKRRGRYGNYMEYNEDGEILDYWNLLKSRRVS